MQATTATLAALLVTPHQVEWSPSRSMAITSARGTRGMYWVIRFRSVTKPQRTSQCAEHEIGTEKESNIIAPPGPRALWHTDNREARAGVCHGLSLARQRRQHWRI